MRDPQQRLPDHAAILATLGRSTPAPPAAVPAGTVVRGQGTALPGPAGVLTAPLSGRPCVWFRVLEWRVPPRGPLAHGAGLTGPPVLSPVLASDMALTAPGHSVTDHESPAPFAVGLPGGEPVVVDPCGGDVSTRTVTHDSADGSGEHVLRREWVLEPGASVFVVGVVDRGRDGRPVLHASPGDCLVVSTSGEQGVLERARSSLRVARTAGVVGRDVVLGAAAGGAVLVALVVLLVLLA